MPPKAPLKVGKKVFYFSLFIDFYLFHCEEGKVGRQEEESHS
jgi:hypothetical protein